MMLFRTIFGYEVKAWFKKPGFYLIAGVCFLLPMFLFLGTGGYFEGNSVEGNRMLLFLNSPFQITSFLQYIGKFLLFLLPAIIGTTIHKDFQHGVFKLLYSFPIGKGTYLSAKFASSFTLVCFISLLPMLAFLSGEMLLGDGNPYITATNLTGYFFSYGLILLPNLLVFGLLVFSVVALFRNRYAGFFMVLLLIALQLAIENLFHQSSFLVALLDPFGQYASLDQTRYWTLTEKNSLPLNLSSELVYNRILWLMIGVSAGLLTYKKFSLSQFGLAFTLFGKSPNRTEPTRNNTSQVRVTDLQLAAGLKHLLFQLYTMVRHQVSFVLKHWIFISFTLMGLLLLIIMLNRILNTEALTMLPLTRLILQIPTLFYSMLVVFATFIFSGMLMLREKDAGMEPLIYSTGVPTTILILSKAVSLILIQCVLLLILMAAGVAMQALNGYFHFDFPQYLLSLFILQAPVLAVWSLLSVFVFSITRHLYLGLFILLMAWLAQFGYEQLGITSKLLHLNTYTILAYSDFNGYGSALFGRIILQIYWLLWGILLLFIAIRLWPRIQTDSFKQKWAVFKTTASKSLWTSMAFFLLLLTSISHLIYQAETETFKVNESQKVLSEFKEKYRSLKDIPQPRISSVSLNVDLFPERNEFTARGKYQLINKVKVPIDTIFIKTSIDEITDYQLDISSEKIDSFPALNFDVYQLNRSLQPGDSVGLYFSIANRPNTLFQKNSAVLGNGTFLTQDILPRIGYFLQEGKKYPDDNILPSNHYQSWDSDLVSFKATVSTSADQLAFTNGRLMEHRQQDGRNYYSYQTSDPVKFNFHFNSGTFDTYTDYWNETPITLYHHPEHSHNLEAIASGVKEALEFNYRLFGYTQKDEINIIEYPITEGSFSTLKTNAIIMSESVFGVNTQQADKINLPFYVASHEMTHHWFGNKLIPKDARGALFLTESITEYLTLQIYKKKYGVDAARIFLKVQHQRYFRGRANEQGAENPLYLVEPGQDYLSYGKGSVALNAIAQTVGTENFHSVLFEFLRKYSELDSYPTSLDFIEMLKKATPNRNQQLIIELLLKSITYNLEIVSAELRQEEQNDWVINVKYTIEANESGKPLVGTHRRSVELGIYNNQGELIRLEPVFESENQKTIRIEMKYKPHRLVLDPNYLILDSDRNNNRIRLD